MTCQTLESNAFEDHLIIKYDKNTAMQCFVLLHVLFEKVACYWQDTTILFMHLVTPGMLNRVKALQRRQLCCAWTIRPIRYHFPYVLQWQFQ